MRGSSFHVYTLDMPAADLSASGLASLAPGSKTAETGVGEALLDLFGTEVDPAMVEVFDVADLADIGLAAYLIDGNGATEAQIEADRARLEAVTGFVLILHGPAPHTADPRLNRIGSYAEDLPAVRFEPLPDASAKGIVSQGKPPKSDARIGGMVATVVLLILFVFTALLIWFAG